MPLTTLDNQRIAGAPSRDCAKAPLLSESLDDGALLFRQAGEALSATGCAGLLLLNLHRDPAVPAESPRAVELFLRSLRKRLAGRVAAGHRIGPSEFLLLLAPREHYDEGLLQRDLAVVAEALARYGRLLSGPTPTIAFPSPPDAAAFFALDGVFLSCRDGYSPDSALLIGLRRLFGAARPVPLPKPADLVAIERIISDRLLFPVFQPIFNLADGTIHAHEALTRQVEPRHFKSAEELFTSAATHGLAAPLERLCWQKSLDLVRDLNIPGQIFINVCPTLFQAGADEFDFTAEFIDRTGIPRTRVTIELTERTVIDDYDRLARAVAFYRAQGFTVAIDDLGTGYAGLKILTELRPDYVKLARFLIADINRSATRQAMVEALVSFCNRTGIRVIAEGVEQMEELSFLLSVGVPYGQGYLLAKPSPHPHPHVTDFLGR